MLKNKSVTVFCSSSNDASPVFNQAAKELGEKIAERECKLIFGGSGMGLMRTIADAVLDNGGDVLGVMPKFMQEVEWNYSRLSDDQLIWTDTMALRKDILIGEAEAIICLPGAVGTLEEVGEALSLKRLGRFFAPVVFINTDDFYTPLVQWLERTVEENLMRDAHAKMWYLASDVDDALRYLDEGHQWPRDAVNFASR